ncbi:MAG: serine/threonine protein kinase, partial [Acidobacteria bacterium]|nr:serine/threonine protein kinase [Acidobacteriota bacterium]
MIGRVLSHYEIVAQIGAGGMGVVYRARDISLGREVALKVLPAELALDPQRLSRFEREATTLAALDHPNIVTIFSVEEADGIHFLTMQLVQGHTLAELIPARGMPIGQLVPIAIGIANALAAAHGRGVVHRDLKPRNVMVTGDGQVKILDFGLAKLRQETGRAGEVTTLGASEMTAHGVILGTTAYMSPEQAEGRPVDQRSDLFSLGVVLYEMATGRVLYEMATGRRPFQGDTAMALLSAILKDTPPPPCEVNPVVPEPLGRVITRCLAKQLDRRYQSALDLRNDLEELALPSGTLARPAPAAGRFKHAARAAILLGIAGLAAFGGWLLWR